MPDNREPTSPTVYQPRGVLHGVSPLIWRRLLIPADTTIADLHAILQTAFGWGGVHLHRFVIHGAEYGIGHPGGIGFRDDPRRVRLGELGLRHTERFTYHYDFTAGWPGGAMTCGSSRSWPPRRANAFRCVPVGAAPVHRRTAAGSRPSSSGANPITSWPRPSVWPRSWACSWKTTPPPWPSIATSWPACSPLLGVERFDRRKVNRDLAALAAAPEGNRA